MWDVILIIALILVYSLIKIHITLSEIERKILSLELSLEILSKDNKKIWR